MHLFLNLQGLLCFVIFQLSYTVTFTHSHTISTQTRTKNEQPGKCDSYPKINFSVPFKHKRPIINIKTRIIKAVMYILFRTISTENDS